MALFYTVDDVRNLFKWETSDKSNLFTKVCVFLAGRPEITLVDDEPEEETVTICPDLFDCA